MTTSFVSLSDEEPAGTLGVLISLAIHKVERFDVKTTHTVSKYIVFKNVGTAICRG